MKKLVQFIIIISIVYRKTYNNTVLNVKYNTYERSVGKET